MREAKPVLYVDDEENNLTVFEAAFEDCYDVYTAISGEEALKILAARPIHVLVTDMRMPGMSGVELLERVLPDYPDTVRIILTGYTDVESVIRAINQGQVHQYITKPWDEREVRMIIDGGLEHYAARVRQQLLTAELEDAVRNEEAVRTVFQRFVPPEITDGLLSSSEASGPSLPAEGRDVTLLFADIRGFTALASSHPPPLILDLLNEYFSAMTEVITLNSGSVNQFLGDAILAVFGAPVEVVDSQRCAVRAALQMVEAIEGFNRRARELVGQPLQIGIGIHGGTASVGVVSAQDRAFYCAAGGPVFEVMRVEQASKGHHNSVIVSENVLEAIGSGVDAVPFGDVELSDGGDAVQVHRVSGLR